MCHFRISKPFFNIRWCFMMKILILNNITPRNELYRVQWLHNRQLFLAMPPLFLIHWCIQTLKIKNSTLYKKYCDLTILSALLQPFYCIEEYDKLRTIHFNWIVMGNVVLLVINQKGILYAKYKVTIQERKLRRPCSFNEKNNFTTLSFKAFQSPKNESRQ